MRIWEVSGHDGNVTVYYEPTKAAAIERRRQMLRDSDQWDKIEVSSIEVTPSRDGIAKAFNNIISWLCANEH